MLDELKAADEEQLLVLEDEFRELTLKEADILEQLTEVRTAKQRVRRLVAEKRNRYAPIFTLPDELLVCIVQAGQQSSDGDGALIEVLASHLSQRFRWAVISAPSLWSSIELRWGVKADETRFAAYLERARACTLSVTCKYATYGGKEECDYTEVHSDLRAVAQHIPRIRRLVLECGALGMSVEDAVAHFVDLRAPFLEYVEISGLASELDEEDTPNYASIFSVGAPRLATLKLHNLFPEYWSPWVTSLTTLDLRDMHNPTIIVVVPKFLSSCPQLVDVTLDDSTYFASDPSFVGGSDITLPALRSLKGLCLNSDLPDALLTGVLPRIHAPALETLQFSGVNGAQISAFFTLLPPAKFPVLRTLAFANSNARCKKYHYLAERVAPAALAHFPALAALTIINVCHVTQLLGDLLATPKDEGSLAALRTLTLRYKDAENFGVASWPKLQADGEDDAGDPFFALRTLLAAFRATRPLRLRLPRSRFFTERDWDRGDADFEMFDAQALLQALGHDEMDDAADLVVADV
ncbi:hypothetical protein B0H17DRAFT_1039554 [Mycena rosella]|uniref:F-box domain-containing protein n=1 Tax=Mycena rosella TaxID=1033263 RepID=A0AAD7GSU2_MYCRO|nr:hypothetical protein B0H17DRAFT_1039554 [Mycena rosella]